jgi:hypothetical protein
MMFSDIPDMFRVKATQKRRNWSKIFLALFFPILIATCMASFLSTGSRPDKFSGKVVSTKTQLPVRDVMVVVDSCVSYDESCTSEYVRTGVDGKFAAAIKGDVSVRVWKPGYAMNSYLLGNSRDLLKRDIVIEIREITGSNLIPENNYRQGFAINDGFSFKLGMVVDQHSADADIRLVRNSDKGAVLIEALEEGGLIFQTYDERVDFYNSPEAPVSGYSKRLPVLPNVTGIFYVLARDGNHFAKVRLIPGFKQTRYGEDYSAYWPQWAYQPDGSRSLEIAIGKEYLFPFEKFGLNRESLR